jgi:hypothetical protein
VSLSSSRYRVFGECLASELAFPNLPAASEEDDPTWRLRVDAGSAPSGAATTLASERLSDELTVTIGRTDRGLRVTYSDTGDFELTDDARSISWHPREGADPTDARLDVVGTLLPLALHLHDRLTLHGSAVALEQGAVTFLAPSGFGKSTLAMSLTMAGARFLSDDAVPVRVAGSQVVAAPGVPSPRFREDVYDRFRDALSAPHAASGGKLTLGTRLGDDLVESGARPLVAVYVLRPVAPESDGGVRRAAVAPPVATMELLRNAKLAKLLWAEESERLLRLVCEVTRRVPVWWLEVPRDLAQLPQVVEQLLAWHGSREAQPA